MWNRYTYICDPDHCDALLELTWKGPVFKLNNLKCPCGRVMQWISEEEANAPIITDVSKVTPVEVVKINSNPYN